MNDLYKHFRHENRQHHCSHIGLQEYLDEIGEALDRQTAVVEVTFDIDSIIGITSNLAIGKQGIPWNPTQILVPDLRLGLHLKIRPVHCINPRSHGHMA